jgi:hypothetical protein
MLEFSLKIINNFFFSRAKVKDDDAAPNKTISLVPGRAGAKYRRRQAFRYNLRKEAAEDFHCNPSRGLGLRYGLTFNESLRCARDTQGLVLFRAPPLSP